MHALPLHTPRLTLRHFVASDTLRMMALNGEPSTRHWLPSHVYATEAAAHQAMGYLVGCYTSPGHPALGPYVLGVEEQASGSLIGHVGLSPLGPEVEVSYAMAEAARGHGFGAEALSHTCQWASDTFHLGQLLAITASANAASRCLLQRAGFEFVEERRSRFQGQEETVSRYRWRR